MTTLSSSPWERGDVWHRNPADDSSPSPVHERKKLELKPRSARVPLDGSPSQRVRTLSSRGDPFGSALPREQVLMQRGIDPVVVDEKIERKAERTHYTKEQDEQLEAVRAELTKIEEDMRLANEMELPEEAYRVRAESKRKELQILMEQFSATNSDVKKPETSVAPTTTLTGEPASHYRPRNERRNDRRGSGSRREQHQSDNTIQALGSDDPFASFSSNRRRMRQVEPRTNAGK